MIRKLLVLVIAAVITFSAAGCRATAGLRTVKDQVVQQKAGKSATKPLPAGKQSKLYEGDGVTVADQGYAQLDMGCCMLDVFINTQVTAKNVPKKNTPLCTTDLSHGTVYAQCTDRITLNAGWVTITNLGSAFWVYYDDVRGIIWVIVKEGVVEVSAAGETVRLYADQQTWVYRGQGPLPPRPATREGVGNLFPSIEVLTNGELQDPDLLASVGNPPIEVPPPTEVLPPTEVVPPTEVPPTPDSLRGGVVLWHSWPDNEFGALQRTIEAFQAAHPLVRIEATYVPEDQLRERFATAWSAGQGPTLLMAPNDWGPGWFDAGLVADMSKLVSGELLRRINPVALEGVRYRGALVGLPHSLRGVLMFRNQSIVPQAPKSFDQLLEMAKMATRGDVVGAELERGFYFSGAHLNGIGGQLMDGQGLPSFYNDKGFEWVKLLQQFSSAGPADYYSDDDLTRFRAGQAGIIIDGSWNLTILRDSIGADNLSVDPWPTYGDGRLSGYVQPDVVYLSAAASGEDREASLRFVEYLLSPESQARLMAVGHIPAVDDVPIDDPLFRQARAVLLAGTLLSPLPEWSAYWGPMDTALRSVFEQQMSPESALEAAYATIKRAVTDMHPQ